MKPIENMHQYKILVTGVGAIIGYGIIKSLRQSKYPVKIIGIDIFKDAVGRVWCDEFIQGVRADSDKFSNFISQLVKSYGIDLIIPGIEQDVDALARMVYKESFQKCKIALNSEKALNVFNNKKLTCELLKELGLPFIPFASSDGMSEQQVLDTIGLPCILKPNISYAGKGLETIYAQEELTRYCNREGYIFQQKITSGVEYTIAIFGLPGGRYCNPINLRRWLGPDGATHKAEVCPFSQFEDQIEILVGHVKPIGPTNFQFIESDLNGEPLLLEVNPRVSSSSSIRTKFGVNEPEMCIDFYVEKKEPVARTVQFGRAQRFIDEVVDYDSNCV